jgi:hypothetical protein
LGVWEPAFLLFDGFVFGVFDTLYFGGNNFLISNPFSTIVNMLDVPRRRV